MNDAARILIIEDDNVTRELMASLLKREHRVAAAASAEEGLLLVERFAPELILLDVAMPGMDGFEYCRKLRSDPKHAAIRVIMVTGKDAPEDRIRGYEAGADNYFTKPVRLTELNAVVRSSLRIRRSEVPTIEKSRHTGRNCWEFMQCDEGRRRTCPAFTKKLGTMCWLVAGTMCGSEVQGVFAEKFRCCARCPFFRHVSEQNETGRTRTLPAAVGKDGG